MLLFMLINSILIDGNLQKTPLPKVSLHAGIPVKIATFLGFQKQVQDIEARLDQGQRINIDERLFSNQPEVQLISSVKEESPEKRARELEAMMMLKEKRKQLEDQYYQRVEQLKMILKKEAELTSIIPSDLRLVYTNLSIRYGPVTTLSEL